MPADLREKESAAAFYDARYSGHYMEEWSAEAKARVAEVLRALNLPATGEALDFGSGNGIMTEVLRHTLGPGWRVAGCDFSRVAVENSRRLYPLCEFYVSGDLHESGRRFDLIFTHHVLEHVPDLSETASEIGRLAKPSAAMVHILPCGNAGSLEHHIATLRTDGIEPETGNRFFFEDEGHLRRLTSTELAAVFARHSFGLEQAFFRNQHFGAIDWISRSGPGIIRSLMDGSKAKNEEARRELRRLRRRVLAWWLLRYPASFTESRFRRRDKPPLEWALLVIGVFLYPISKLADLHLTKKASAEWHLRKAQPNGSEMFLLFRR